MKILSFRGFTLFAFGSALAASASLLNAEPAIGFAALSQTPAKSASALPVTTTFEKLKETDKDGHYVMKVTNTSKQTLKITAAVVESVTFHAHPKNRSLPEHAVAAGETWTVDNLAPEDKVTLTAAGFDPLVVTVK